ncbi:MAG: histidine phosphatase family protein [Pikeienuella sp.]
MNETTSSAGNTLTIGIMRHFQTDWNALHKLQGRTDRPLTDDARKRLQELSLPAPWDEARLIATPLSRAQDTAQIVADREPEIEPDLIELSWGAWEGQRGVDLLADPSSGYEHVENWGWGKSPPRGESPAVAWERIAPVLRRLAITGKPSLLVVHRGIMRVIMAKAWGWDFDCPEPFKIKRERIYPITLDANGVPIDHGEAVRLPERST